MLNLFPALILLILQGHSGSSDSQMFARLLALQAQGPSVALRMGERSGSPSVAEASIAPLWFQLVFGEKQPQDFGLEQTEPESTTPIIAREDRIQLDPRSAPANFRDGPVFFEAAG